MKDREPINFDRPTSELIDDLENIRDIMTESYDEIIEYLEKNLIKKLYPTVHAWLEYPEDEFDKPMNPYSEELSDFCDTLESEDEWHLVFPVMVTSKNRDVQVGSLDLSTKDISFSEDEEDIEDISVHLQYHVNRSLPKSYVNMLTRDTDSIAEEHKAAVSQDPDTLFAIFETITTTEIYRLTMATINSDRIIKETLSNYSLPFINDLSGIKNKSAAVIPYMETFLIYEDMKGKLKDSIDAWCRENVQPDAFSDIFLMGTSCMVSIMTEDDYGCSLTYEFSSQTAQASWPTGDGGFTELTKKLKSQKNRINDYVQETITELGIFDACQDLMLYQIDLEMMMENNGIGYKPETDEDEECDFKISLSKTTFPKEIWKDKPVFTCSDENIESIRDILPRLKQHASKDDSFTKIEY